MGWRWTCRTPTRTTTWAGHTSARCAGRTAPAAATSRCPGTGPWPATARRPATTWRRPVAT
eukprot:11561681-Alexandrium_andersonii.AAC.1